MIDYLRRLPMELIHQILDNVPTFDIFSSLSMVDKRLRSVALAYPRLQPDFSCVITPINKKYFDAICTQLRRSISHIVSLTLFDKDDSMTPIKNALFFSRFNYIENTFSNLRSLTITYIDYHTWCAFKPRLPPFLVTLSIHLVHVDQQACLSMTSAVLTEILFFSLSLECLSIKMINFSNGMIIIHTHNRTILPALQYFHSENITIDLSSLLLVTPMLRTLEISCQAEDLTLDKIPFPSVHLQRLRVEVRSISWGEMVALLASFPQLTHLAVTIQHSTSEMGNGLTWASLLQKVQHFDFQLRFSSDIFRRQLIDLHSFRTKFWLEEKKWSVTYDQHLNNDYVILYTRPSSMKNPSSQTTMGILASESTSFDYVHCLIIDYQHLHDALLHHYIHLPELHMFESTMQFPVSFKYLPAYLNTWGMTTCHVNYEWTRKSSHELVSFLRTLPCLRAVSVPVSVLKYLYPHQWSNIIHLRIESDFEYGFQLSSSHEIDALCRSFTHIERLDIHSISIIDLPQLLRKMKRTLINIIIRQLQWVNKEELITRQWIERETDFQHCHYIYSARNSIISSLSTELFPLITSLRPNWSPSNTDLHQFTGGIKHTTFGLFYHPDPSEALVIKIFGSKTEEFIDRKAESHALHHLSQYQLAQPVLLQFASGLIYQFVPGEICTREDIRNPNIAALIAYQMAKLHSIPLINKNEKPCLIPLMRKFLALIDKNHSQPEDFISLTSTVDWIEKDVLPQLIPHPQIDQFTALSHLCFGLCALAQVHFAKGDSDHISYGRRRLHRFEELKSSFFH